MKIIFTAGIRLLLTIKIIRIKKISDLNISVTAGEEYDNFSNKLLERVVNTSMSISIDNNLTIEPNFMYVRERYAKEYFNKSRIGLQLNYNNFSYFSPGIGFYHINSLIYDYASVEEQNYFQFFITGDIGKHFSYTINSDIIFYPHLDNSECFDKFYLVSNGDFIYNFTNLIALTSGFRFNNYECNEYSDHWGFYANFSWEFLANRNIYLGYKTMIDKYEKSFSKTSDSGYIKISYQF